MGRKKKNITRQEKKHRVKIKWTEYNNKMNACRVRIHQSKSLNGILPKFYVKAFISCSFT